MGVCAGTHVHSPCWSTSVQAASIPGFGWRHNQNLSSTNWQVAGGLNSDWAGSEHCGQSCVPKERPESSHLICGRNTAEMEGQV